MSWVKNVLRRPPQRLQRLVLAWVHRMWTSQAQHHKQQALQACQLACCPLDWNQAQKVAAQFYLTPFVTVQYCSKVTQVKFNKFFFFFMLKSVNWNFDKCLLSVSNFLRHFKVNIWIFWLKMCCCLRLVQQSKAKSYPVPHSRHRLVVVDPSPPLCIYCGLQFTKIVKLHVLK